jgi:hypothetical protein
MITKYDIGELAYGGAVTLGAYLDDKRVTKGTLVATAFWKKYSTWVYLGLGVAAVAMSAMGWMRKYETWAEHVSHGFIYALPGFALNMVRSMQTTPGAPIAGNAAAEAQRLMNARRAGANRMLGAGQTNWIPNVPAGNKNTAYSVVNDTEIMV